MSDLSVSTIIPTYNRANLIARAVESAIGNSRPGDEIIVVDDGSTDNTREVLARFADRIRYLRTPNSGAGAARNRAVREAKSDLVALLDSDDEWMSGKLELQRRFMAARPDVLFCFSDFVSFVNQGNIEIRHASKQWTQWGNETRTWDEILSPGIPYSQIASLPDGFEDFKVYIGDLNPSIVRSGYINADTLVARRKEAGDALHFIEGIPLYEEQECYGLLARSGLAAYLDVETVRHYSHAGERLTGADALLESSTRIEVTERVWGSSPEYMAKHGDLYTEVIDRYRAKKAASLISLGRAREARQVLKTMKSAPGLYRALAVLPGPLVRELLRIRRTIRTVFKGDR